MDQLLTFHILAILSSLSIVFFAGWLVAPLWVLLSSRTHGAARFGWLVITLFTSWLGLGIFWVCTQAEADTRNAADEAARKREHDAAEAALNSAPAAPGGPAGTAAGASGGAPKR
jgi:hypothetical protein